MFDFIINIFVWCFFLIMIGVVAKAAAVVFMAGWNFL